MSKLSKSARRKSRKKQSQFQKLWAQAERLRQRNQILADALDALVTRLDKEVRPQEMQLGRVRRDVAMRLIESQSYKSLSGTQRWEINSWVEEIADGLNDFGLLDDELRDALARNEAQAMGIELDENSKLSAVEQIAAVLAAQMEEDLDGLNARTEQFVEQQVQQRIRERFGKHKTASGQTQDMFQTELDGAEKAREEEIAAFRESVEKEIREQLEAAFPDIPNPFAGLFGDDFFGDDSEQNNQWNENEETRGDGEAATKCMPPKLQSDVFKRLFRKTAIALHPDKEQDETRHAEKQQLMGQLLTARKQGDLLTLFQMHQQYVGTDAHLDASDEKQLLEVLKFNLEALRDEELKIARQSPAHINAYTHFYAKTKKATDRRIMSHLDSLAAQIEEEADQLSALSSLKNIKEALKYRQFGGEFEMDVSELESLAAEFPWFR